MTLLLIFIGVCCLFPLSLYFLFLASLHQRPRPTMISGVWDAIALILGLTGFLLVGGTVLVFSLDRAIREYWLWGGTAREWLILHTQAERSSKILWGSYVVALPLLVGWAIRSRRRDTVFYQLTPDELEELLPRAFHHLNLELERRGRRWWLPASLAETTRPTGGRPAPTGHQPLFTVDGSETQRISVIRWQTADSPVRDDVEAELGRLIREVRRPPSPAGVWFLAATGFVFLATFMLLGMILFRIER